MIVPSVSSLSNLPDTPVLVRGLARDWPAANWTPESLVERFGERQYTAEVNVPEGDPTNVDIESVQKTMTLAEFIDGYWHGSSSYIANKNIDRFPGLVSDVPNLMDDGYVRVHLWIGSAQTKSSLHFDHYDNYFTQIFGEKKFYLASPKDSKHLRQYPGLIDKSRVDPESGDREFWEATVGPGDVLYVPRLWWHCVRSISPSISITCFHGERAGVKELLPIIWASGPIGWVKILFDFVYYGALKKEYRNLYAEPFGLWLYQQARMKFRLREE